MKLIQTTILVLLTLILSLKTGETQENVKPADFRYRGKATKVFMDKAQQLLVQNPTWIKSVLRIPIKKYRSSASGVAIAYGKHRRTYALTAQHVAAKIQVGDVVWQDKDKFNLLEIIHHPSKDISILTLDGFTPYVAIVSKLSVEKREFDITVGILQQQRKFYVGEAFPGMSGGGVYSVQYGLHGIISRTTSGVVIYKALQEMNMEQVLQ